MEEDPLTKEIGNLHKSMEVLGGLERLENPPQGIEISRKTKTNIFKLNLSQWGGADFIRAIKIPYQICRGAKYPLRCNININQWTKELLIHREDMWVNISDLPLPNHRLFPVVINFDVTGDIEVSISYIQLVPQYYKPWVEKIKQGIDYYSYGFKQN